MHVRYDIENTNDISENIQEKVIEYVINKKDIHGIIFSDYDGESCFASSKNMFLFRKKISFEKLTEKK